VHGSFGLKMFAQQKVTLPKGRQKIIILDEADRYSFILHNFLTLKFHKNLFQYD